MIKDQRNVRILFVCLGNICRSPAAEGVFRHLVQKRGLSGVIRVDSAGTGAWHVGEPPDQRMRATARGHGISLDGQKARQLVRADLDEFDLVLVMDRQNLADVLKIRKAGQASDHVRLFREFDPEPDGLEVPDPYWSGADGFENVFHIIERTADSLLTWVEDRYGLSGVESAHGD